MSKLTAIVIGKNEEAKIEECLKRLKWADELLFFDDGSTDKTSIIAEKNGAKVIKSQGKDYASRKNFAFSKTSSEWFLSIDADERVSAELAKEIIKKINGESQEFSAYAIPRKNIILGREFKHGGEWPDYVIRLFKKKNFVTIEGELHEQPKFKGELGYLKNPILHLKHDNLSEMLAKTNEWSEIEARLMYENGHPPMNLVRFATAGLREFWRRMIIKQGFKDGPEGVIYSQYQVISRLISYAKLWEMQVKKV